VIIPTLNEEENIRACIAVVRAANQDVEILVADGGSQDQTVAIARKEGALVCHASPGRGEQCNAGANLACGEILLFLHADSRLPTIAFILLREFFQDDQVEIGTFRLKFDHDHWLLALYAIFSRFDTIFTRFGDQCIVVRRPFFDALGGFPDWPLFEDVKLLQMARQSTRIHSFPAQVTTSARRYLRGGVVRQQLINLRCMIRYLLGVSPAQIALEYERYKTKKRLNEEKR
jgi:rSAM/selenodomain-associated transferase 2